MKYKVLEESFIADRLYEKGAIVEYTGKAGPNLEALPVKRKSIEVNPPASTGKSGGTEGLV